MKDVIVTLLSQKPCELGYFLNSYYGKEIINEEGSFKWSCYYDTPCQSIELISALIDNEDTYKIETYLTLSKDVTIKVTCENIEQLIRILVCTN